MKRLLTALLLGLAWIPASAQEEAPSPTASPAAESKAPKIDATVDLSETQSAENLEIPPPTDSPDPEKTGPVKADLPGDENATPAPPVSGQIEVTAVNAGQTVRAALGNLIRIKLEANPSTGYNWELRDFDYGAADYYGSETVARDKGNVLFGAPGDTIITLQAVKPGTQEIKLVYRRVWEAPDQVAQTFAFMLEVSGETTPAVSPSPAP